MNESTIRRAVDAWCRGYQNARSTRAGRGAERVEGETADDVIEAVCPFRRDPSLYMAYEREVRERAYERLGITRPAAGNPTPHRRGGMSPLEERRIVEMYERGEHVGVIARRIRCSHNTIAAVLVRHGVRRRRSA